MPTGRATFGLPLYSYTDGGRLSVDLSLNYTCGGGIPINQIPTSVGLGWELTAGGMITRRTIGTPDDQIGGTYDGYRYGDGFMVYYPERLQPIDPTAGFLPLVDPGSESVYQPNAQVLKDRQQDVFDFQFGGRSGSFIISQSGFVSPLDNSKLSIQKQEYKALYDDSTITTISSFTITDERGIRYTFSETDRCNLIIITKGTKLHPTGTTATYVIPGYTVSNYYTHNTWYLKEIYDPFSGHKITFNYQGYKLNYIAGYDGVKSYSTTNDGRSNYGGQSLPMIYAGTRKRLSSIQFPDNTTSVSFIYNDSDMVDLPGQKPLNQILIKQDTVVTSGYQFAYEYFFRDSTRSFSYSFSPTDLKFARLSLKSVQKLGRYKIPDAPYKFTYYNKVPILTGMATVPPRAVSASDHFGFNNNRTYFFQDYSTGDNTFNSLEELTSEVNRIVDPYCTAMLGGLREVWYPSGGKLLYEYENNDALSAGTSQLSGGIRVKRTTWYDMVDTSKKIIKEYKYVNADGTSSGWGYEKPILSDTSYSRLVIPPSTSGFKVGDFVYSYTVNPTAIKSVGNAMAYGSLSAAGEIIATQLFWGLIIGIIIDIFTPPPTTQQLLSTNIQYYSTHPSKNNLLPHMYKRVEVYEGTQVSSLGKTVNEFTSPDDFPLLAASQVQPYSNKTRCLPWVYGLPKKQQEIAQNGSVRSETVYAYLPLATTVGAGNIVWRPKTTLLCPESMFTYYASLIELYSETYTPIFGRTDLGSMTTKMYDSTGNFTQTSTSYVYNPLNLQPSKINAVNSLGDTIQTRSYYTTDYAPLSFPALWALQDANAVGLPVSSEVWQVNTSGQKLLTASNTEYKFQPGGDIQSEQIQVFQNDVPLSAAQAGSFSGTTLNRMPGYVKKQKTMSYDGQGNLVHVGDPNRPETGYQWGYGDKDGNFSKYVTVATQNAHAAHSEKTGSVGTVTTKSVRVQGTTPQTLSFTLSQPSTVYISITDSVYGSNAMGDYTLSCSSPSFSSSGRLLKIRSTGRWDDEFNNNMGFYPQYYVYTNLPAGTYTLSAAKASFAPSIDMICSYFSDPQQSISAEFYYNGFEDTNYADTIVAYAGKGCYKGDYTVSFSPPAGRSYRIDYRYFSAGKWVYTSKTYVSGMVLSDGNAIDEVRVYPTDADIMTYTYEPGVGLTSKSDRNGNTEFSEYDYLSRLSIVRDKDRNIIKRICYNYAGQPEQCGGQSYTNDAFSQVFTNNTCGNGFTPGADIYIVPAGKYTSDDKNMANYLAQEDIRLNGQKIINQTTSCSCGGDEPGSEPDHKVINGNCVTGVKTNFNRPTPGQPNLCDYGYYYKFPDGTTSVWIVTQQRPCN
ncbi:DUF5977 domain-containing protein [Chryseobacterium sp. 22543]|uniref:DUF5977 domain-containing protein n=1 Tax=Chryseobacterium sp. 22543 TaxID=3453940 RepID=UPI003F85B802